MESHEHLCAEGTRHITKHQPDYKVIVNSKRLLIGTCGFELKVVLHIDWLPTTVRNPTLPSYLNQSWEEGEEMDSCFSKLYLR